jgi:hypothetical protein
MRVSETFCQEQEALQRAKAAAEPLESRRKIALTAAAAWAVEGALAKTRALKQAPLDKLDADIAREFAEEDADLAEQPDASDDMTP